jgi:hypothetical protein
MSLIPSGSLPGGAVPFKYFKRTQYHKGVNVQDMTGPLSASFSSAQIQILDPGGSSRDFVLPSCSGSNGEGSWFQIFNNASAQGEIIDVVDEADVTLVQVDAGAHCLLYGDADGTCYPFLTSGSV